MRSWHSFLCAVLLSACGEPTESPPPSRGNGAPGGGGGLTAGPVVPPTRGQADLFAEANNRFAVDLWQQLRSADGNLLVSPASISVALGMTWAGARGTTATQMAAVMHFGSDEHAYHAAAGATLSNWNDPSREAYQLSVADRLFGQQTYRWQEGFLAITRDVYHAPLEPTDFLGAPEAARAGINSWVAGQTHDRIRNLLPKNSITTDTRMVLVNAVYLHAGWVSPFESGSTYPQPFFTGSSSPEVPMMHQTGFLRAGESDGVQLVEMPYRGGDLNMLIALPTDRDGFDAMEAGLDRARLRSWTDSLESTSVALTLPKFRIEPPDAIALRPTLIAMGMSAAFDPDLADFSAMASPAENEGVPLYIDAVFHKAFVAVDEDGTEAAAATAVVMAIDTAAMAPEESVVFTADHPFMFFIRDANSGAVLFMGRVMDPA